MAEPQSQPQAEFDAYAESYRAMHEKSVAASGEDVSYFSIYKTQCLQRLGVGRDQAILDFGCGIGNLTQELTPHYDVVHGFDPSEKSLEVCKTRAPSAVLHPSESDIPNARFDIAVLSGVLHHVPPPDRTDLLHRVGTKLKPGGRVVIFEHNPLNPMTVHIVRSCEFDDDAVLLWPWEVKSLVRTAGYRDVALDYIMFFPRALAALRSLEPRLRHVAIGAQTMTVASRV